MGEHQPRTAPLRADGDGVGDESVQRPLDDGRGNLSGRLHRAPGQPTSHSGRKRESRSARRRRTPVSITGPSQWQVQLAGREGESPTWAPRQVAGWGGTGKGQARRQPMTAQNCVPSPTARMRASQGKMERRPGQRQTVKASTAKAAGAIGAPGATEREQP